MKQILTATILVTTLGLLSACGTTAFVERRAELCPTCTDAEWQIKVQENAALEAEQRRRNAESARKYEAEQLQIARDQEAFGMKYPRCYHKYRIQMGYMGVKSPEFLALCEEYMRDIK